jgi:hypothetical protein
MNFTVKTQLIFLTIFIALILTSDRFFDFIINILNLQNRSVAQLAEHVTLNHGVEGSSPSRPAKGSV